MPCSSKTNSFNPADAENLKLVVINSSSVKDRFQQMLRIRPTVLARTRHLTVGPMYLVIEHALELLCGELEGLPKGKIRTINAFDMDPTVEDKLLLTSMPHRRNARQSRKEVGDEVPALAKTSGNRSRQ